MTEMADRRRRFHPAPAGRVMATGVSVSATLGIMAVLAANQPTWSASSAVGTVGAGGSTATATTVVTDHVPRTIVLQPGEAPPAPGTPEPATSATRAGVIGSGSVAGGSEPAAGRATSEPGGGGTTRTLPVDTGRTGGGAGTAPAPTPTPEPIVTAPPVTAPAPVTPPATTPPVTTAPPPPTCSGSKC